MTLLGPVPVCPARSVATPCKRASRERSRAPRAQACHGCWPPTAAYVTPAKSARALACFRTDRCRAKTTSRKGEQIDLRYSGKRHAFGGNIRAAIHPDGFPVWVGNVEPGSVHDLTYAQEHALGALYAFATQGLPTPSRPGLRRRRDRDPQPSQAARPRLPTRYRQPHLQHAAAITTPPRRPRLRHPRRPLAHPPARHRPPINNRRHRQSALLHTHTNADTSLVEITSLATPNYTTGGSTPIMLHRSTGALFESGTGGSTRHSGSSHPKSSSEASWMSRVRLPSASTRVGGRSPPRSRAATMSRARGEGRGIRHAAIPRRRRR